MSKAIPINFKISDVPKSKNIKYIGYDAQQELLLIEFSYGGQYIYQDVPENMHDRLLGADSTGSFFSKQIKDVYDFTKVDE